MDAVEFVWPVGWKRKGPDELTAECHSGRGRGRMRLDWTGPGAYARCRVAVRLEEARVGPDTESDMTWA